MSVTNKKSPVWSYFSIMEEDTTKAKCKICNVIVSRGGIGKKATTSALNNHLKNKHPNEKITSLKQMVEDDENQTVMEPSTSRGIKRKQQQTLEACLEKKKLWDINDSRSTELHYAIGEMIALDNQPYSMISDNGFTRLMKKVKPQYQLPSRKYLREVIVPDIFKKCKSKIFSQIEMTEFISITSDVWTDSINNYSFISFTGHWIDDEFESKTACLNVKYFPGSHTGENICKMLLKLSNEWNVTEKIHLLIRDNGANMVKGVNDAALKSEPCFIHTLQLVVNDAMNSQRVVKDIIAGARQIVTHFNHSSVACTNFCNIQTDVLKQTPKKLIQDVKTRWNSTYYMLERLLEQKKAISLFSAEHGGITNLKSDQWSILESILHLLQPFAEVTKMISSTKSLISEIIPTVCTLERYLTKSGMQFFGVGTMKDALKNSLSKRFSGICNNDFLSLATLLDPRYKTVFFNKNEDVDVVKNKLQALMMPEAGIQQNYSQTENINRNSLSQEIHSSFWECFNEMANPACNNPSSSSFSVSSEQQQLQELNSYLTLPLLIRSSSPLTWWGENNNSFPSLAKLAKQYLSAPASSVYSERLFSEAGNIYEKKRNKLLPENAEELLFLHHNLPLLNFEY